MRKLKIWLFSLLLFTYIFSATKITLAENRTIEIPNTYFTSYDINNWNKSNVILNDKWTNWIWLFFLWDEDNDDTNTYELKIKNTNNKITCTKQLKWYYTNNFLNFQIFPIYNQSLSNWVTYQTWWLFYDCKNWSVSLDWVYWYIKWTYKSWSSNVENTHEIIAWTKWNTRATNSQLKLVNSWSFRALSGQFKDYLANTAIIIADMKDWIFIDYPDDYFTDTDTFSWNQNEIYFNDSWNDWFGLFFLWTWIENWPYEITDKYNTTLSCSWQLNWYYSFSFNDFGMLPLDSGTESQRPTTWIDYITWWLYYNCRNISNNKIYTWVYWYIKRDYNYGNIHEIRAWMTSNGKFIDNSPIEVIYSDNFRNINRTLSWQYHDNLAKNSKTEARFFWDIGILSWNEEIKATWSLDDPYIILPIESYRNSKIYVKSSKQNTSAELYLTAIDNGWQIHTTGIDLGTLTSQRSSFWFYAYKETSNNILDVLSPTNDLKSGTINFVLYSWDKTRSQKVRFVITGSSDAPDISVTFSWEDCSKTWVTIVATSSWSIEYTITDETSCTSVPNSSYIPYPTAWIYLTWAHKNKLVCFRSIYYWKTWYYSWPVTWIDTEWPTFELISRIWYECQTWEAKIENRAWVWCSAYTDTYYWNGSPTNSNIFTEYTGKEATRIVTGEVMDGLWNITLHTWQIKWNDAMPEIGINQATLNYTSTIINTTTLLYTNLITEMWVTDGEYCWNSTISKTWNITCTEGTWDWVNDWISVTPRSDYSWDIICTVHFADDEWNIVTGTIVYHANTIKPNISITWPNPNECSSWKTVSATYNGWNMRVRTWDITVCSWTDWSDYTSWTPIQLNSEDYNWKYICFKAVDSIWNIAYKKVEINNIDTTAPEITYSVGNTKSIHAEECSKLTLEISATDKGCGQWKMTLIVSWQTIATEWDGQIIEYPVNIPNTTQEFEIPISVIDNAWNIGHPIPVVTINPKNKELSWRSFNKALEISNNENGIITYTSVWNWKFLTHAEAWDCENITITDVQCPKWDWATSWENFSYMVQLSEWSEVTGLHCNLTITDWDTDIHVTWYFIDCNQTWNNECKPILTPIFTWWEWAPYIHYRDLDLLTEKYSSWTNAYIQINWQWISDLSWYRFTCVQQGRYCLKFEDRNYTNINANLTSFIENNWLRDKVEVCVTPKTSRSEREPYIRTEGEDDIFNMDLHGAIGACNTTDTVYASKYEWTRNVWIELIDTNWYTSIASTDNMIYSEESPIIRIFVQSEYDMRRDMLWWSAFSNMPNIPTINSWNITVNIVVDSAELPTWKSWQNYNYKNKLQRAWLLPWPLWFDNLNEWLITHYWNNN